MTVIYLNRDGIPLISTKCRGKNKNKYLDDVVKSFCVSVGRTPRPSSDNRYFRCDFGTAVVLLCKHTSQSCSRRNQDVCSAVDVTNKWMIHAAAGQQGNPVTYRQIKIIKVKRAKTCPNRLGRNAPPVASARRTTLGSDSVLAALSA